MPDTRTILLDDPGQLPGVFAALETSFDHFDFTELFDQRVAPLLAQAHRGFFAAEESPSGQPWEKWYFRQPSAAADHKTLHVSGALEESLTSMGAGHIQEAAAVSFVWGTNVPYSYQHQDGGVFPVDHFLIGRRGGVKHVGDTINLPQREHVGMNETILSQVTEMLADETIAQIRGY